MGLRDFQERHARTFRAAKRRALEFGIRPLLLHGRIRHLYGPTSVTYGSDELLVITVVRNGAFYVKSFMEHYLGLGVAHCVVLDNGSTDDTLEMLREYPRVTVLQTDAPYDRFENTMKRVLAERFSNGRWNLCADIDELFEYPFSNRLTLAGFLQYLDSRCFTAVATQMLDMFSPLPLVEVTSSIDDSLKDKYQYYDISDIDAPRYEWSTPSSEDIRMHWGGIRRTVFGTGNGLTKASLVKMNGRVKPFVNWHHATGALVADVSCVLLHYPFIGTFAAKVADAVRTRRYGATTSDEYAAYADALARTPRLSLMLPTARRFTSVDALIDDRFLVVSEQYRKWVETSLPPSPRRSNL